MCPSFLLYIHVLQIKFNKVITTQHDFKFITQGQSEVTHVVQTDDKAWYLK